MTYIPATGNYWQSLEGVGAKIVCGLFSSPGPKGSSTLGGVIICIPATGINPIPATGIKGR